MELSYIDRFGVEAVFGRKTLAAGEIFRMMTAENIRAAFRARRQAQNWAEWASENPQAARMLADIEKDLDGND